MKIGYDAKRLFNNFTGIGNFSRTLVDILSTEAPDMEMVFYTPKVRTTPVTLPYLERRNCRISMPTGLMRGGLWRTFSIAGQARRDGVDLFHGLSNELPVGLKVPSVVTIHDVAFHCFHDMYHWQDRRIYDMKWRHACSNADRVIAISQNTKDDIVRFYDVDPEKIDVVYQPVALRYYEKVEARPDSLFIKRPYMLYVGTVNSRKNLLGAVKALRTLPADLQIPIVCVGGGSDYKRKVQEYVAEHHMEGLVIFPDHRVEDDELHQLLLNAELFVYPSFYEGFGLPVVEALLCGCPVLTSNISSLPEAGGPDSLQADPASVEDIAEKMRLGLTDSALRERMITRGREYAVRMFHPEVSAKAHIDIYNKVINGGK